jgi:hypothetical protein
MSIILSISTGAWFFHSTTPFYWVMRGAKKLLINTMLKVNLIKRGIPELGPIVIANSF